MPLALRESWSADAGSAGSSDGGARQAVMLVWLRVYPRIKEQARPIPRRTATAGARWIELLGDRNVLALVLARFLADPVWYFFLFWTPEYLKRARGFSLADIGLYGWIPFVAAFAGGMFAGLASDWLIRRGWGAAAAR